MRVKTADVALSDGKCSKCGKTVNLSREFHNCKTRGAKTVAKAPAQLDNSAGENPAPPTPPASPLITQTGDVDLAKYWGSDYSEIEVEGNPNESPATPEGSAEKEKSAEVKKKTKEVLKDGGTIVFKWLHRGFMGFADWMAKTSKTPDSLRDSITDKDEKDWAELGAGAFPLDIDARAAYVIVTFAIIGGHIGAHLDGVIERFRSFGKSKETSKFLEAKKIVEGKPNDGQTQGRTAGSESGSAKELPTGSTEKLEPKTKSLSQAKAEIRTANELAPWEL